MDGIPDEVLLEIFQCDLEQLVLETHVCRKWREIGLRYPSLWSEIRVGPSRSRLEAFLLRSRSIPIAVDATLCTTEKNCKVCLENTIVALGHSSRIHTLKIVARDRDFNQEDYDSLRDALQEPMPIIEIIELNFLRWGPLDFFHLYDFPPNLQRIRRVILEDVALPWTSEVLHNLTHLSIDISDFRYGRGVMLIIEPSELLDILRASPYLQLLYLNGYDENIFNSFKRRTFDLPPPDSKNVVNMLYLLDITLKNTFRNAEDLLSRIKVPTSASLHFMADYSGPRAIDQMTSIINATYCPLASEEHRSAEVIYKEDYVQLRISKVAIDRGDDLDVDKVHHLPMGKLTLTMRHIFAINPPSEVVSDQRAPRTIARLLQHVNSRDPITYLGFTDGTYRLQSSWKDTFLALPSVQYISFRFALLPLEDDIFKARYHPVSRKEAAEILFGLSSETESNGGLILPQLSHLKIKCSEEYLEDNSSIFGTVFSCLESRKEKGAPQLRSFKLIGPEEDVRRMTTSYDLSTISKKCIIRNADDMDSVV